MISFIPNIIMAQVFIKSAHNELPVAASGVVHCKRVMREQSYGRDDERCWARPTGVVETDKYDIEIPNCANLVSLSLRQYLVVGLKIAFDFSGMPAMPHLKDLECWGIADEEKLRQLAPHANIRVMEV